MLRILYVAPRFHPNQVPIVEGLIRKGHNVSYFVRHVGVTEHHAGATVTVIPASFISKCIFRIANKAGSSAAEDKMLFWFIPNMKFLWQMFRHQKPDVVILRERNLFSLSAYFIAQLCGCQNCILYNQSPIYEKKMGHNLSIKKRIWRWLFPTRRISVCRHKWYPEINEEYHQDMNATFLPFIPRKNNVKTRNYSNDGIVRILDMGKYREYKNHYVLVNAVEILIRNGIKNIFISIYGQKENLDEIKYYEELRRNIAQRGLSEYIQLHGSVDYQEVPALFLRNDAFVLTSKQELANISILDAMSFGMVAIATDKNGTSDYIRDGKTGLIYKSDHAEHLAERISMLAQTPEVIKTIGTAAMVDMCENYGFESYYKKFLEVVEKNGSI